MLATLSALEASWVALGKSLDVMGARWLALWPEIVRRYEADGRFYHTLAHIQHMMDILLELPPAQDPASLHLALWLHDLVYDAHRSDNEEESARLAGQWLTPFLRPAQVQRVRELILATKHHHCFPHDEDCALLMDVDLAILGAATAVYRQYARAIRQEYAHVPTAAYRKGRVQLLQALLARPFIYHIPPMRWRYEQAARQNMQAEIFRLR